MNDVADMQTTQEAAERIRVQGLVQGVGFRPTVWRLARRYGLRGSVANDGQGVSIHVCGPVAALDRFAAALLREAPPLARIDRIEREPTAVLPQHPDFRILGSHATSIRTGVVPDAAACPECVQEVFDPFARRYRYPFTNCTRCGPRLSIIEAIPYDRATTTMRAFAMCPQCSAEYADPADRRFHAQPIACHACGPRAWLERADGAPVAVEAFTMLDDVDAVCTLLQRGHIVAIKGLGGFQLACDACNEAAVARLRRLKRRSRKPFALMARDVETVRRYCAVTEGEEALLRSPAGPIVVLDATGPERVAESVAPGVKTLGFMLPNTPLHHLMLRRMNRPIVLTSGNRSDEPQCIDNAEARARLGGIAEYFLMHNRDVARRVDDSVVREMAGAPRVLRRGRGYAPAPLSLAPGFSAAPAVLAMGGELKNTFCLLRDGRAIVSHHMGDLEDALTYADYRSCVEQYLKLFEHEPRIVAVDCHPEYLSRKWGQELSARWGASLLEVQHHHAHIAACLAENAFPLEGGPVIGVALDGMGFGTDGTLWGGEFLLADYRVCKRLGTFKPVAMPGGEQAVYEPWRNTYAHLMAEMGWARFAMNYAELDLYRFLEAKPRRLLDRMISRGINSPLASSCGRLFDAVAAAAGVCRERVTYEGEAAVALEALVDERTLKEEDELLAYPFAIPRLKSAHLPYVEPLAMWQALLGDLLLGTPVPVIAARFHKGLAMVIARMVDTLSREAGGDQPVRTVALSGGVFQNRVLLEQVTARLKAIGFEVLTHRHVPPNDGGLALGQAAVAAARSLTNSQ
ncbi:carbamoyltransferase HypF [Pelomicrobium sp. G1]|uniref:carbamoyltransferase HypF n=1 Tax=unclassified Pelomicrobium TaxID=2815318 RepID=UPI003F76057B